MTLFGLQSGAAEGRAMSQVCPRQENRFDPVFTGKTHFLRSDPDSSSIYRIVIAHVYRDDLLFLNQKLKGDSIGKID